MNGVMSVVSVFAIGYAVLASAVFFYQPRLLYFPDMPTRQIDATPEDIGLDFESVTLVTSDNVQLDAWFLPADPARGTLLFCHGNAGNISHRLDSLRLFHELGLSVLIFDYRGYGQSTGTPTEEGTYRVPGNTSCSSAVWPRSTSSCSAAHSVPHCRQAGKPAGCRRCDPGIRVYLGARYCG
jgi:pimeloyl-ACP methyl ester carboxylesterase